MSDYNLQNKSFISKEFMKGNNRSFITMNDCNVENINFISKEPTTEKE